MCSQENLWGPLRILDRFGVLLGYISHYQWLTTELNQTVCIMATEATWWLARQEKMIEHFEFNDFILCFLNISNTRLRMLIERQFVNLIDTSTSFVLLSE